MRLSLTASDNRTEDLRGRIRVETTDGNHLMRKRENRYLQDRVSMRTQTFSGMGFHFHAQDAFATESQGPVQNRTEEHLVTSDKPIVAARKLLLNAIQAVRDGREPPHLRQPGRACAEDSGSFSYFRQRIARYVKRLEAQWKGLFAGRRRFANIVAFMSNRVEPATVTTTTQNILKASAKISPKGSSRPNARYFAATKMSLSGLYYYFSTKEELLYLIQERCFLTLLQRWEQAVNANLDVRADSPAGNHLSFFA
jgi:hypothetical protein